MKKYLTGTLLAVIITPIIVFSWGNVRAIWAGPEETKEIKQKVEKQGNSLEQISSLYLEQKTRQDTQEALNELREQNLKEQLMLIAELKKKR